MPAEHDSITAGDLAQALPVFGKLAPNTPIGPAPGPGVRRVFRSTELISLARNHSLQLDGPGDLCFELPLERLDRGRVLEAMKAALPFPETRIDIVETSLYPVPRGRVEFRREDLGAPALPDSLTPVIWRGNIVYGANRQFAIWAHVVVMARRARVIAAEPIRQGGLITVDQLRVESKQAFPLGGDSVTTIEQVAGRLAVRAIEAGQEVRFIDLDRPRDVKRGDTVAVEVRSGAARLAFAGKSESDGRIGDMIKIRNLRSNKIFQARVEGPDKALLDTGVTQGN
jgi:flagella basal body P-ring formation protein FlgA